ncbi:MAG TPA: pyridine nucleotide-disulfide oxidoreductase, partial [Verrucomicrobiae bacterium]|nr:pyridine nucleotide-disulfide oxidoreductase [Verrucomicrobiae bacterium]
MDARFLEYLRTADLGLHDRLVAARSAPEALARKEHSLLLIDLAPHLEDFLAQLFQITPKVTALQARHHELAPIYSVKRRFVQRKALAGVTPEQAAAIDGPALQAQLETLFSAPLTEQIFAEHVSHWLENEAAHAEELALAARYAAWATLSPAGRRQHRRGVLFKTPHKLDMTRLVPVETLLLHGVEQLRLSPERYHHREGFALTDPGMDLTGALDQAEYCIKCHNQGKDSCSTGLREKDGSIKLNALGIQLAGCPLEEKISEMHQVKARGNPIGALAIITIDNPMAAGTGHRI